MAPHMYGPGAGIDLGSDSGSKVGAGAVDRAPLNSRRRAAVYLAAIMRVTILAFLDVLEAPGAIALAAPLSPSSLEFPLRGAN